MLEGRQQIQHDWLTYRIAENSRILTKGTLFHLGNRKHTHTGIERRILGFIMCGKNNLGITVDHKLNKDQPFDVTTKKANACLGCTSGSVISFSTSFFPFYIIAYSVL